MRTSFVIKGILAAAAVAVPLLCSAESNYQTGAGTLTATAHVDFQITIPQFLFLRVGNRHGHRSRWLCDECHDRSDHLGTHRGAGGHRRTRRHRW